MNGNYIKALSVHNIANMVYAMQLIANRGCRREFTWEAFMAKSLPLQMVVGLFGMTGHRLNMAL